MIKFYDAEKHDSEQLHGQIAEMAHEMFSQMMEKVLATDSLIRWPDAVFAAGLSMQAIGKWARIHKIDGTEQDEAAIRDHIARLFAKSSRSHIAVGYRSRGEIEAYDRFVRKDQHQ
jgi:hypothetical protein